jgi:tetratricopeptide (TPR) repeat protein
LDLANKEADWGNFQGALNYLKEAYRLAVSTDNPALLIRTRLAQGNALFSLGRGDEAVALWRRALTEAEQSGETELAAATRIYLARARLLTEGSGAAAAVKAQVEQEVKAIKSDALFLALGWTVIGLAEKEQRQWNEAEAAIQKALDIHDDGNYLAQAAYDWYLIASVRSVAGQYDRAVEALQSAIAFDRRCENTYGLASDWKALGEVYKKTGKTAEAEAALERSAEIFTALKFPLGNGNTAQGNEG